MNGYEDVTAATPATPATPAAAQSAPQIIYTNYVLPSSPQHSRLIHIQRSTTSTSAVGRGCGELVVIKKDGTIENRIYIHIYSIGYLCLWIMLVISFVFISVFIPYAGTHVVLLVPLERRYNTHTSFIFVINSFLLFQSI